MMQDRFEQAAARCEQIKLECNALLGSRDYGDRARRVVLRREFREASFELRDACNDIQIMLGLLEKHAGEE